MRSTRATSAVERLNGRSEGLRYSMVRTSGEQFYLQQNAANGQPAVKLNEPLPLDEFAAFVNGYGPQKPRRVTKSDAAFEKQLVKRPALAAAAAEDDGND